MRNPHQSAAAHSLCSHVCGLQGLICQAHVLTNQVSIMGCVPAAAVPQLSLRCSSLSIGKRFAGLPMEKRDGRGLSRDVLTHAVGDGGACFVPLCGGAVDHTYN